MAGKREVVDDLKGKQKKRSKNESVSINLSENGEECDDFELPGCTVVSAGPHHLNHISSNHSNKKTQKSRKQKPSHSSGKKSSATSSPSSASSSNGQLNRNGEDSDQWQTCIESWQDISGPLSSFKKKRVWMPFYYDGECAHSLRKVGFKSVYHKKRDFFSLVKDSSFLSSVDVIIDNPPYTGEEIKSRVLIALEATKKPFAVLLPMTVLHSKLLRDVLDTKYVQTIIPRKVMVKKSSSSSSLSSSSYEEGGGGGGGECERAEEEEQDEKTMVKNRGSATGTSGAVPFKYLVWLCYRMNLKSDLYFV
jgi:hypothetical protein